jgi:hypothetical protein
MWLSGSVGQSHVGIHQFHSPNSDTSAGTSSPVRAMPSMTALSVVAPCSSCSTSPAQTDHRGLALLS